MTARSTPLADEFETFLKAMFGDAHVDAHSRDALRHAYNGGVISALKIGFTPLEPELLEYRREVMRKTLEKN